MQDFAVEWPAICDCSDVATSGISADDIVVEGANAENYDDVPP